MPPAASPAIFIGFHGCDYEDVESIKKKNFFLSKGSAHLLGDGVYFFIEGFGTAPKENARNWAIAECYKGNRKYSQYAVLSAVITPQRLLDVTCDQGKETFHQLRELVFQDITKPINNYDDYHLLEYLVTLIHFDAIIQDLFFEFKREAMASLKTSHFPNVRVMCVRDPDSAVDKLKIDVTDTGPTS